METTNRTNAVSSVNAALMLESTNRQQADAELLNLITAIEEHESHRNANDQKSDARDDSEANQSVDEYKALKNESKQDLLNFLRSL